MDIYKVDHVMCSLLRSGYVVVAVVVEVNRLIIFYSSSCLVSCYSTQVIGAKAKITQDGYPSVLFNKM